MKKIFYTPTKPFYVGQAYGENTVCVDLATNSEYIDCEGWNPPNGYRSVYGENGHLGVDIPLPKWKPIVAAREGIVVFVDKNKKTGYDVRIESIIDGRKYTHIYEHMVKWKVEVGDRVKTGQLIGWVGTTGLSLGNHLHWEIWDEYGNPIDPMLITDTTVYAGDLYPISLEIESIQNKINILKGSIARYLTK